MVDIVTRSGKGSPLTNAEVDANFTNLAEVAGVTGEPMGFEDAAQSTISFNAGSRTFTITPVSSSFTVWCKGKKVVVSSAQTVTVPDTTGLYTVHFNPDGVLDVEVGYFTFATETPVAYVYWNADTSAAPYFADERHGVVLDWQTHEYLHRTRGAALASGFVASGYTTSGSGSADSDAQLSLEGGTFFDEDLMVVVVSTDAPLVGTWQQDLSSPAKIPVLHLQGTAWVMDAPTDFPFKQGTARPQYNLYSGGVWSTADVTNNKYATTWILATNNLTYPVIAIIGQAQGDSQGAAEAFDFADLQLPGFPSVEFRPLYKLIFHCADSYSNSVNAKLVAITDIRNIQSAGASAALTADHGNLSGLSDDDHQQYLHVDIPRLMSDGVKASFLPAQTGNSGKLLTTNGTVASWGTLSSGNVTTALGFTPYNASNPSGYVNTAGARSAISVTGAGTYDTATGTINIVGGVTSVAGKTGIVTLNSSDVGLGNVENKSSVTIRSELTSTNVTTALGFTPYNATNPAGYISGNQSISLSGDATGSGATAIAVSLVNSGVTAGTYTNATVTVDAKGRVTSASSGIAGGVTSFNSRTGAITLSSADVTTALGFTPYNSSNPSGYQTAANVSAFFGSPNTSGTLDWNHVSNTKPGAAGTLLLGSATNGPTGANYYHPFNLEYNTKDGTGNVTQMAVAYGDTGNQLYMRGRYSGVWTGWTRFLNSSNFNSYAPTLTGTGASGTWAINIGGSAVSASSAATLTTARNINGVSFNGSADITVADATKLPLAGGTMTGAITFAAGQTWPTFNQNTTGSSGSVTGLTLTSSANGINPDSVTQNQIGYNTSVSLFGQTDGGLYSSAYSSSWVHQIYGDFRTGQLAVRGKNSGTWQAWRTVLDSGNYTSYRQDRIQETTGNYLLLSSGNEIEFYNSAGVLLDMYLQYSGGASSLRGPAGNIVLHAGNYSSYALPLAGGTLTGTATGVTSGSTTTSAFYAATTGGSYASMYGRYAPYRTSVVHTGSSYAPALSVYYEYTGSYSGHYSIGHLTTSGANPGNFVIHHINSAGAVLNTWSFDGANGNFVASGNVTAYSDERLKKDWAPVAANFVSRLATVKSGTYTRIDSGERQAGSSAQDWQALLPEVVTTGGDDDKTLALAYGNAALVSAVELAKEVVELRAKLVKLEALVAKLIED